MLLNSSLRQPVRFRIARHIGVSQQEPVAAYDCTALADLEVSRHPDDRLRGDIVESIVH